MKADGRPGFDAGFGRENDADSAGSELNHAKLQALAAEINRRFPPRLEQTAVLLYELDPERLQVQWNLTPADFEKGLAYFPGNPVSLRQVVRLCRLEADGKAEVVDRMVTLASVSGLQGQQRFAPARTDAEYECELGLESGDGAWLMLVRSNRIRLAGQSFSPPAAEIFAATQALEALTEEAALAADGETLQPVFPSPWATDDPRHPALSARAKRQAAGQLEDVQGGAEGTLGPYELTDMPPPLLPSGPLPSQAAGDGFMTGYDPRTAFSSAALRGSVPDQLGLELRAELLVEGRAAPDSRVQLFGISVAADGDGRFSIRHPISDPLVLSLALGGPAAASPGNSEQE